MNSINFSLVNKEKDCLRINDYFRNMEEFWKQYKDLEIKYLQVIEDNKLLKFEIKKLEEKNANELINLKEIRKKYEELEIKYHQIIEENNGFKSEIKKLYNIQNILEENIDNKIIKELNDSKSEEKDSSIKIYFNPNIIEESQSLLSLSSLIYDCVNSFSFNSADIAIKKIIFYSSSNEHFICQKNVIKFLELNSLV